jgi:hypothetical protein
MTRQLIALSAFTFSALALSSPSIARSLGEAGELEHARANARAGGPTNDRDAELLERHGCLSGTRSSFCKKLNQQARYRSERRYRDR